LASGTGSGSAAAAAAFSDGTSLAVATTTMSSASLFPSLAAMAEVSSVGSLLLTGTAGAVIGAGTSLGIFRFAGARPTLAQSVWFTNVTAWGALAGLSAYGATPTESAKVRFGLLAGGQVLGLGLGAYSATRFRFTIGQTVLADSLVLSASLASLGFDLVRDRPLRGSLASALATAPLMLGSAAIAYQLAPTADDLHLMGLAAPSLGLAGGLLAAGALEVPLASREGLGGATLGLGLGYVAATLAAPFVDLAPARIDATAVAMLAGDGVGLGLHMLRSPDRRERWPLGAAIGGLGAGALAFVAQPYVTPGPAWPGLTLAGAGYGGGAWLLAALAGAPGDDRATRAVGGTLAGSLLGGAAGLVASRWFRPDAADHATVLATTTAGVSAGLGAARVVADRRGDADSIGVVAGAAGGLALGALVAHHDAARAEDGLAAALGAGVGGLAGGLVPTLDRPTWSDGRTTQGGAMLGAGAGALGFAATAHALDASAAAIGVATVATGAGTALGYGVGLMAPGDSSRSQRIGVLAGQAGTLAAWLVAEPWLRLRDGLGPRAFSIASTGALVGTAYGALAATLVSPGEVRGEQVKGGAIAGGTVGVAGGLVLGRWFVPEADDHLVAIGGSALGHSLGFGIAQLTVPEPAFDSRADGVGRLAGGLGGLLAGALIARRVDVAPRAVGAGVIGAGYGALLGALTPSLDEARWDGGRTAGGGANVGLALGGGLAIAAAHASDASAAEIVVPSTGAALGAGVGLGAGLLVSDGGSRAARVGIAAGTVGLGVGAALAARPLDLANPAYPHRAQLAGAGGVIGGAWGALAGDALYLDDDHADRHIVGGLLAGSSAGVAAGFASARFVHPTRVDSAIAYGGGALGGGVGLGAARLAFDDPDTADAGLTLGGSVLGLGAAAWTQHVSPLRREDGGAAAVGAGFGGLLGALAPRLGDDAYGAFDRANEGGLLVGGSAGALVGAALGHATGASGRTIGLTALGGGHGLVTGLGVGMLLDDDGDTQARRVGVAAGAAGGLALGALWLPRADFTPDDQWLIGSATIVGGWTGSLLPILGHADWRTVPDAATRGGALAGAGLGSLAGALAASAVEIAPARVHAALALDGIFTGAGVGLGALVTPRDDGPVLGAVVGGTAGLALGGALAEHIDLDRAQAPLFTLAATHGAWLGGWTPYLVSDAADGPTDRQLGGGAAAGMFGGLGLAALASRHLELTPGEAGKLALSSALGSSIAGGAALVATDLSDRARVGAMLGGTTGGLALGAALMPGVDLDPRTLRMAALGGALGTSEGLAFAWAGRGDRDAHYWGAALLGGGLGTTLGLAGASSSRFTAQRALVASGFGAWGGWIGSFSGALIDTDPHAIVLGGMAGANLGLVSGYALTRTELFAPADFGWLSLAGAVGTVGGAGVGALFSNRSNRDPIFAGLAVGPVAGMATGALTLPALRKLGTRSSATTASRAKPRRIRASAHAGQLAMTMRDLFTVADWQPMVGALPSLGLTDDAPPVGGGLTGTLR
jgi:hypothetical protein